MNAVTYKELGERIFETFYQKYTPTRDDVGATGEQAFQLAERLAAISGTTCLKGVPTRAGVELVLEKLDIELLRSFQQIADEVGWGRDTLFRLRSERQ